MKTFRSAVKICLLLLCLFMISTGLASADTVTLSGNVLFSSLDGSAQDSDGLANDVFTVDGDLIVAGTINCNDGPPLSGNDSACPIRITVTGDLTMEAGSGIFAENRRGGGRGGDIRLDVGGDLTLQGPGAVVSSSRLSDGNSWRAGNITLLVGGGIELQEGSAVAASTPGGLAGTIAVTAEGTIQVAGMIVSGPSRTLLPSRWTGLVLGGAANGQSGGPISLRSHAAAEPAIRIDSGGAVASQGEDGGGRLVLLEGCGIEVRGLVASVSKQGGPSLVALRSGKGILVDGRDLGVAGGRLGRIRADGSLGGAAGYLVDLFAANDIQVLGPDPSSTAAFTVSSSPGSQAQRPAGGTIAAISLSGSLTAAGKAFEAGRLQDGNRGGTIDLKARGDVSLDEASLAAVGDFTSSSKNRAGGRIFARSYRGAVSWTFGVGDVRPTGTGVSAANRGTITLTACTTVDTAGSQFLVTGAAIPPFPVENEGVCSPLAPVLPSGEPPLSVCNEPPVANAQAVETDEDTPVTITLTGSDPNADPLTFSIATPPAHGSLGPLTSPTATSVQVVYTPSLNYNGSDSFTFQVDDGHGGTDTATVTITINAENDAPLANDDTYDVDEGETLNVPAPGVLDNDTDPESDNLTAVLDSGPSHASSFTLHPDGSFTYVHDGSETTSDSFTYHANDGAVNSNMATVSIEIIAENDAPIADDDGPYSVDEDATLNVPAASGVLIGDIDPEGDGLTAMLVASPAHASSFTFSEDGSFTYVHNGSETTSDSFTYKANDGTSSSNVATVAIIINPMNDPPTPHPDAVDITEEAPNVAAANTVSGNVLSNDTDPDNSLVVSAVAGGSVGSPRVGTYGSVTINSNGSFTYTLDDTNPAVNALVPGGTLIENFGYTASDGALTGSSTLTVTIHGADDPATPDNDAHEFIGNTELRVDLPVPVEGTPATLATTPSSSGVLDGDIDPEGGAVIISGVVGCSDVSAPFDCTLPGQGDISLHSTGRFTFVPEPGDTDPTANFQYTLAGNPAPATVTLTRKERVWYVKNNDGGGTGVSNDPFATLTEAQTASVAGDTIYVFEGNGGTTGYDQGIVLKSNQRLIGEGVQLDVPVSINGGPNPTVLRDLGNEPDVDNTNAGGHAVSATDAIPARIAGLNLIGSGNAIDITTNGAFSGSGSLTIANNTIDNTVRPGGAEGIDINAGGTGSVILAIDHNNLTAAGTAIDIQKTGTGTLTIMHFEDNAVNGNTGGSGIVVSNAVFDSVPGGGLDTVNAGTLTIGAAGAGNGVGGAGLALGNVQGDLHFSSNLNIFAEGGAGLTVLGTGAGFQLRVNTSGGPTGIIEATGGAAVDASTAALDLRLTSLKSTNSAAAGVSLTNVTGTFSGDSGSITNATGTDFAISGGTANVTYKGTITDDVGQLVSVSGATAGIKSFERAITDGDDGDGSGISLSGNTGATIRFSGGLTLSTGGNPAFAATGGGTIEVCDETLPCNGAVTGSLVNKITTTTGAALHVANTTISANNLEFRSISANGAPNGIILNTTGSLGGLSVKGTGSAGSGGTIQNITNRGASFINAVNIALTNMSFTNANTTDGATSDGVVGGNENTDENGAIHLQNVTQVDLTGLSIDGAVQHGINGNNVTDLDISNTTIQNTGDEVWESGIYIFDLKGLASAGRASVFNNVSITNDSGQFNMALLNGDGSNNRPAEKDQLEVTNSQFTRNGNNALISDNVTVLNSGTANFQIVVSGSTFNSTVTCGAPAFTGACVSDNIQVDAGNTAAFDAVISSGNNFTNGNAGQSAVNISASGAGQGTFNVSNIVTTVRASQGINVALTTTNVAASLRGTIANNNLSTNVTNNAGSGIQMVLEGSGTMVVDVNNNTINGNGSTDFDYGIRGGSRAGGGVAHFQVNNNSVPSAEVAGVWFFSGNATAGETSQTCVNFVSNLIDGDPVDAFTDYFTEMYTGTTFQLQGLTGPSANAINVQNFIAGTDDDPSPADPTVDAGSGTIVNYTNAVCQMP